MTKHVAGIIVIASVLLFCIFLPYMPGEYDGLAVTLSLIVQLFSITGLLLVPVGIIWLILQRKTGKPKLLYRFAVAALVISFLVVLVSSAGAFGTDKRFLSFAIIAVGLYQAVRLYFKLRSTKNIPGNKCRVVPLYLISLPLLLFLCRFFLLDTAIEYSRNVVIKNSGQLVADIEIFYKTNGHYPTSMLSVNKDYKTGVVGVQQYHYEQYGNAYNVYFEHFSKELGSREIVMYNKLDEQEMTSHDEDLLLLTPADLHLQRGYIVKKDLPVPHWKYFLFD